MDGKNWPTAEHYFQAKKFIYVEIQEEIRNMNSPMEARNRGKDITLPLRADWVKIRDNIMREAIFAKFTQHPDLLNLLKNTGTAYLVEHTKNDSYWGDGGHGRGMNMLGRILVETREKLIRSTTSIS